MSVKELTRYNELISASGLVEKIISPEMGDAVFSSNEVTVKSLQPLWQKNTRKNLDLYKKHGSLFSAFNGFCSNKAVIAVGAGPSFNKNKDAMKEIYKLNIQFPLDQQPFFIIASNKQFKPLLEKRVFYIDCSGFKRQDSLAPGLCSKCYKGSYQTFGVIN